MEVAGEFIGRFHPALVHLPIGILMLAVLFVWVDRSGFIKISHDVIRFSFGIGAFAAVLSAVTGLFLSQEGGYDDSYLAWHQWMGISTAIVSLLLWRIRASLLKWTSTVLLVMLVITGHLGASLTHGADYLTAPVLSSSNINFELSSVNYDSARLYADVVAPILEQHCYSCHGPGKQKGKLRLDRESHIKAGGKNGAVITPGSTQESELISRLRLPIEDDHHMPPRERPQPAQEKIAIIARWIESGALFDASINKTITRQEWTFLTSGSKMRVDDIPDEQIAPADELVISDLRSVGVSISRVSQESNYLQLNFIGTRSLPEALQKLESIAGNVVWVKLGNTDLNDSLMSIVGKLTNVTRLALERTPVTDEGIAHIRELKSLAVLNLGGTMVSKDGLAAISNLKQLRSLNLYQSQVRPELIDEVRKLFPAAEIEFGEYQVPLLPTDTIVIK